MNAVQERASLDEKTVQRIARDDLDPMPKAPRRRRQSRSGAVSHTKVNSVVWEKANDLLLGSYSRIEIVDEHTVIVR